MFSQDYLSSASGGIAIAVTGIAAVSLASSMILRRSRHYPPGPPQLPIVGNWFDLPSTEPWVKFADWSEHYQSDLIHLNVFGTHVLVVNSAEVAKALFEGKSALYGDRPRMTMLNELVGLSWLLGFIPQGDTWKTHRKILANNFNPASVSQFRPHQLKWRNIFLQNLLKTPDEFFTHIQHLASGLSLDLVFGLDVASSGEPDPFIHAAHEVVDGLAATGIFGTYLHQAKHWKTFVDIAINVPFDMAAEREVRPSIASRLVHGGVFAQEDIRKTTSTMFANGSAALVSALRTFLLAMSLHPEIQHKAHNEIDVVLLNSGKALPDFDDELFLPYTSAIVKEVLRWNPVVPLAFAHRLTTDDVYNGYHLPAGSVVLPNAWPERFLTKEGALDPNVKNPEVAFGFGRRICPARNFASSELFIFIASTLAIFEITSVEGLNAGAKPQYTSGLLRIIKPRSPKHKEVIEGLAS
ncbi:MAG: cytochrome P450 [Lentinula lateritia]|nr:MAG: cytochrome P450 [Lentinula lateritia]